MAVNAIAIKNTMYEAILEGKVKAITISNYMKEYFNQFE